MNELLGILGKRVRELRAGKKWSQEEFAHISGLHRTYIGQIERGEKNISFENLSKVANVLGVTLSELLAGLENAGIPGGESEPRTGASSQSIVDDTRRMFEIHRMATRLKLQSDAMNRTVRALEDLTESGVRRPASVRTNRRTGRAKK